VAALEFIIILSLKMIGARVGTIMAAKNRGIEFATKPKTDREILTELVYDRLEIEDRDIVENKKDKLRFRRWPYAQWCFGAICLAVGSWLTWFINYGEMSHLDRTWFQIVIITVLLAAGLGSIASGEVHTVVFENAPIKDEGTVMIFKTNILCGRKYDCYCLSDIAYVSANKRGQKSGGINTTHYVLLIGIKETFKTIKLVDTTNELRVKKSLLAVR
jgi:hypothetical protein